MISEKSETMLTSSNQDWLYRLFVLQFDNSPYLAAITETATGKYLAANKAFIKLGWQPEELVGKSSLDINIFADPADRARVVTEIRTGKTEVKTELLIRTRQGQIRLMRFYVHRLTSEKTDVLFTHAYDITEETRLRDELSQSESLFRNLFSKTPVGMYFYRLDTDNRLIFQGGNPAADQMVGISHRLLVGKPIEEAFPGLKDTELPTLYRNIALNKVPETSFEIHYDYDQLNAWFNVTVYNTGHNSMAVNFINITKRIQDEERIQSLLAEKELLLKETHHRIKNNMSIVKSILSMQAAESSTPGEQKALQVAAARVESMMVLYDKLYTAEHVNELDLSHYLPPLVHEILRLFDKAEDIQTSFAIAPVVINPRLISPLGIIINELVTNSLKHAFGQNGTGLIKLTAGCTDGMLTMAYADSGPGLPENPGNGLGMLLINSLAKQIDGTISSETDNGALFTLHVKVK